MTSNQKTKTNHQQTKNQFDFLNSLHGGADEENQIVHAEQ
jgi:hypothetical protein